MADNFISEEVSLGIGIGALESRLFSHRSHDGIAINRQCKHRWFIRRWRSNLCTRWSWRSAISGVANARTGSCGGDFELKRGLIKSPLVTEGGIFHESKNGVIVRFPRSGSLKIPVAFFAGSQTVGDIGILLRECRGKILMNRSIRFDQGEVFATFGKLEVRM